MVGMFSFLYPLSVLNCWIANLCNKKTTSDHEFQFMIMKWFEFIKWGLTLTTRLNSI